MVCISFRKVFEYFTIKKVVDFPFYCMIVCFRFYGFLGGFVFFVGFMFFVMFCDVL
tara:strand:+ start:2463 stop:2630 length:168 start_codon:yes stop_codon:yes gene_type:complete